MKGQIPERTHCEGGALVDVSTLSLDELVNSENPALTRSLARLLEDVSQDGVLSAFNSFVA
jgi:FXSXX-COOH protein